MVYKAEHQTRTHLVYGLSEGGASFRLSTLPPEHTSIEEKPEGNQISGQMAIEVHSRMGELEERAGAVHYDQPLKRRTGSISWIGW